LNYNNNMVTEEKQRTYIAIDLKSFYASVECQERGLDPLNINLVVADESRTEKTICLAVSPSLKAYGIPSRCRLFEVNEAVRKINQRRRAMHRGRMEGTSCDQRKLAQHPEMELDFHIAVPRMALYIEYSTRIYSIYLKYISEEDIHIYSIDEVFMDVTDYLNTYQMSAHELAMTMIRDVLRSTGITATAGIGTNMYLAKVAMDIVAKHIPADEDGVRIAELDEMSYRRLLWNHRPLRDFWRVGRGYVKKLEDHGLYTMGDIARCSLENEDLLYKLFGVNAELLIDHAWGWEPCTIKQIREYVPQSSTVSSGQVLSCPYSFGKAEIIVKEMSERLALDLMDTGLLAQSVTVAVGYDVENLKMDGFSGKRDTDWMGRAIPKGVHGTVTFDVPNVSASLIRRTAAQIYRRKADPGMTVRRITIILGTVSPDRVREKAPVQLDLFSDPQAQEEKDQSFLEDLEREKKAQEAIVQLQKKFGKNTVLKGMNLEKGATMKERNKQIGGHRK